jgi:hypothetical protein
MKSNFKDNGVSPKISASQGSNAKLMTPIATVDGKLKPTPGKHPFKPADPLRKSKGSHKAYA